MKEDIKKGILNYERWLCNYITPDYLETKINKTQLNLKFAIQISGGLRHFKYVIPWINHFIIEPLNADVFVHGWCNNLGIEENESHIINYKNIKKYQINNINDENFNYLRRENKNIEKVYGNFFNVFECNNLRKSYEEKNNIQYDFIIKCRTDAFFFAPFEDDEILNIHSNNFLGIPRDYFSKVWCPYITDMFAMGNREVIDMYCQAYNSIQESFTYRGIGPEDTIDFHIKEKMKSINIYNLLPNWVIDYLPFLSKEELDKCNTRFNSLGAEWSI